MWWRFTLTSLACLMWCQAAQAQTLESALMPGAVIEGHAKFEAECANCHVRFDRGAQAGLCLGCHKPVRADVNGRIGYHGRSAERGKNCRTCHTVDLEDPQLHVRPQRRPNENSLTGDSKSLCYGHS